MCVGKTLLPWRNESPATSLLLYCIFMSSSDTLGSLQLWDGATSVPTPCSAYISWQKISGKNPACCKNLCSNLAYLPPLSLTKYANVIGPPLLANAWIWPQENGAKGTYLNKCFFSYCKNDSRHCKNDSRQSDYIFFSTKVDLIAIYNTILL